jgi:hypothetical protein
MSIVKLGGTLGGTLGGKLGGTSKGVLRSMVRGMYDLQKVRIQLGNRIVGNFKAKHGQRAGLSEKELKKEAKEILTKLRASFERITDGIVSLPRKKDFKGDEVISEYAEFCLMNQYITMHKNEKEHLKHIGAVLDDFEIYNKFLEGVKGIGPAMAGVIISELDPHKAHHISGFWKYSGLDVVGGSKVHADDVGVVGVGEGVSAGAGRSKRKEHLVEKMYMDKKGKEKTKKSITYNPFLKTKLMGVLGGSFLKSQDKYAKIYDDSKHRYESHAVYGVHNDGKKVPLGAGSEGEEESARYITSKNRRHFMATRYMVKMFLLDLWLEWRKIEKLPISKPYSEAKLGYKPHHSKDIVAPKDEPLSTGYEEFDPETEIEEETGEETAA